MYPYIPLDTFYNLRHSRISYREMSGTESYPQLMSSAYFCTQKLRNDGETNLYLRVTSNSGYVSTNTLFQVISNLA